MYRETDEVTKLRQQNLGLHIKLSFVSASLYSAQVYAKAAQQECQIMRRDIEKTIRNAIDNEMHRVNKLRTDAIQALSALNDEAKNHVKGAVK